MMRPRPLNRTLAVAGAMAALAVAVDAAAAAGTHREVVDSWEEPYSFVIDCAEFGPFAFVNEVDGVDRVRITEISSADGELLSVVIHGQFRETDTNATTGAVVRLTGSYTETWDLAADTRTIVGKVFVGLRGGSPPIVQDTGRIVTGLSDHSVLRSVAGPHEAYFGDLDQLVCEGLAG